MGKRTCSDIETADESVQNDEQFEQHEEAKPKRGHDLVSGGVNCKLLYDLCIERRTRGTVGQECSSSLDGPRQMCKGFKKPKMPSMRRHTLFDTARFSVRRQSRQSAFEESALDDSCERNKVDVTETSRRSRNTMEQFETAVKKGKGSAVSVSKSITMVARRWGHGTPKRNLRSS